MTNNQINYLNYQENSRSNQAKESETQRHNFVTEQETAQHNRLSEQVDLGKLAEVHRSNVTAERETQRSNLAREELNRANLRETSRHNLQQEAIGAEKNAVDKYIAQLQNAMRQAELSFNEKKEAQRIVESLRDYELELGKAVANGVTPKTKAAITNAGTVASAALGGAVGTSTATKALPAASSTLRGVVSKLSKFQPLVMLKQLMPDYNNYTGSSSGPRRGYVKG